MEEEAKMKNKLLIIAGILIIIASLSFVSAASNKMCEGNQKATIIVTPSTNVVINTPLTLTCNCKGAGHFKIVIKEFNYKLVFKQEITYQLK